MNCITITGDDFAKLLDEFNETLNVVTYCPKCDLKHIDAPEEMCGFPVFFAACRRPKHHTGPCSTTDEKAAWTNPPHKTHLCHGCGELWRPFRFNTNGVESLDPTTAKNNAELHRSESRENRDRGLKDPSAQTNV